VQAKSLAPSPRQRVIARLPRASIAAVLAAAAVVFGLLFVSSDRMQSVRQAERARAVEADDREFCSKLGIQPHAPLYPECRAGLHKIRLRHQQRTADIFY
jgi:hypothetical protein